MQKVLTVLKVLKVRGVRVPMRVPVRVRVRVPDFIELRTINVAAAQPTID